MNLLMTRLMAMQKIIAIFGLCLLLMGCTRRPTATFIAIDQPFAEAEAIARAHGYDLHPADQLAMAPTPDGFYVLLPGDRMLIVLGRDAGKVDTITLLTEASKFKAGRESYAKQRFDFASR